MTKTKIAIFILVALVAGFVGRVAGALTERHLITMSGVANGNPYAAVCWTASKVVAGKEQP